MYESTCWREWPDHCAAKSDWNSLIDFDHPAAPFMSHQWYSACIAAYSKVADVKVHVQLNAGRVVAAQPIIRPSTVLAWPFVRTATVGAMTGRTCLVITRGSSQFDPRQWVDGFTRQLQGVSWFDVDGVLADGSEKLLGLLRAVGCRLHVSPGRTSPYLVLRDGYESWWKCTSRSFRYDMQRTQRRLESAGAFEVQRFVGKAGWKCGRAAVLAVSGASWKAKVGTHLQPKAKSWHCLENYAERVDSGEVGLDVWVLYSAAKPVAIQIYVGTAARKCLVRADFDVNAAGLSPGKALLLHVVKSYAAQGAELDFGGMDYPYKLRWTETVRSHLNVRIYGTGMLGTAVRFGLAARRIVRRGL